jgi:4-amino-4-deoxy-L-arabinose transferase-like glycosyltransferase
MKLFFIKNEKRIILLVLFIFSIFLITFHFTDTPKVWVDEGVFTETARNLAKNGIIGLQTEPGEFFSMRSFLLSSSYPVIFPVASSFIIFGTGIWQARLPMIIYMLLLVIVFYLFVKNKYGFYPAVLSVLLLLSFSPFYGNGRPVQGEVPGLVFMILGLFMTVLLEKQNFKNNKIALFSGICFGLSASIKPIFLVGVPIAIVLALLFVYKRIADKKTLLFLFGGFILPVLLWVYIHIPTLDELLKFVPNYIYFSGNHGSSLSTIQTILMNLNRFITESTPILFLFLFIIIAIYFFKGYVKDKEWKLSFSELIIVFFVLLNILSYLKGTGWYRYFFPANILLYLLFPISILSLGDIKLIKPVKKFLIIIPTILIVFQFYHLIFLSDTSFVVSRTRNAELSSVLSKIEPTKNIFFFNTIEAIVFFKGNDYSQYLSMGDFLKAGNINSQNLLKADIILADDSLQNKIMTSNCYKKVQISRYYLLEKIDGCFAR